MFMYTAIYKEGKSGSDSRISMIVADDNDYRNECNRKSYPIPVDFPREHYKDYMVIGTHVGTIVAATSTGWLNKEKFLKFLNHFIKHVKSSKEEHVLLIMADMRPICTCGIDLQIL